MRILCVVITIMICLPFVEAGDISKLSLQPYEFEAHSAEKVKAELGEFVVPENRKLKGQRKIRLRFVRFASTSKDRKPPIVYLAGGPGGSGIEAARGPRFPLFMAMREFGDVIALDQRGIGMSEPNLGCEESYTIPLSEPADRKKAGKVIADASRKCFDRLRKEGIDMAAYNTIENAADLNDLRIALGADRITLWGISYGTHLALAAMKYHGAGIDRVILAGVEPLHHTYKLPADQQKMLEKIAALSKKDPKINAVLPDFMGSVGALMKKLEQHPETVSLTHPLNGATAGVTVGKFDLQSILARSLTGPEIFSGLPDFISRLEKGDWTALALAIAQERLGSAPNAMTVAMDCASGIDEAWRKKIAEQASASLLSNAIDFPFPEICEGLPDLGDDFRKGFTSDIPALLISGTLDGRTSPANAEEVAVHLKNHQHLIIEGAGHSDPLFLSSPLILTAMKAFMNSHPLPANKIVVDVQPFIAPRKVVTLSDEVLNRYVGVYEINEKETRRVIKAGNILYTQRGEGNPRPIRPVSETEFFYEGSSTWLRFEVKAEQKGKTEEITAGNFEFVNGQWFDGKGFRSKNFYSVDGFLTSKKPEKIDRRIDLSNKYVIPPFGEAHNHNVAQSSRIDAIIRGYLEAGIFYVKNPNSLPRATKPLRGKINTPQSIDATFSNGGLTGSGGHPIELVERNIKRGIWTEADGEGAFYFTVDSKADLDKKWDSILAGRPDFIKTYLLYSEEYEKRKNDESYKGWRGLNPDLLPEIVQRAHKAGLTVSTHVESAADFHNALIAGVDEINHMPGFRPEKEDPAGYMNLARYEIFEADAQLAGQRKVIVVTTIGDLIEFGLNPAEKAGGPQGKLAVEVRELLKRNLRKLQQNHVPIAIGSDSYERTSLNEIMNLKDLGLFENTTLLKMWCEMTTQAIFPKRKILQLNDGYEASFLVLKGDPLKDFMNVKNIEMRVKQGEIISWTDSGISMIVFQEGREPGERSQKID